MAARYRGASNGRRSGVPVALLRGRKHAYETGDAASMKGAIRTLAALGCRAIDELVERRNLLFAAGALVGESDHGVSKSLYARDPDGIEFEVMWAAPKSEWANVEVGVFPLDLDGEVSRWAATPTIKEINL